MGKIIPKKDFTLRGENMLNESFSMAWVTPKCSRTILPGYNKKLKTESRLERFK